MGLAVGKIVVMVSSVLGFDRLLGGLTSCIGTMKDGRQPSNATRYRLQDAVLGAFSAFFMQSPSFLEYQRQLQSRHGQDNAQSLFGLTNIPSVEQIRNILDPLPASGLSGVFISNYQQLEEQGYLRGFEVLDHHLLVALDGTQYYSSHEVSCPCCSIRTHRNGQVTYSHKAILPVIVSPSQSSVISLPPEFIYPQDGHDKQDCEQAAAKRWIEAHGQMLAHRDVILLGDDLYSRLPMCETVLAQGMRFIFVCLPESHPVLYDWIEFNAAKGQVKIIEKTRTQGKEKVHYQYRYLTDVPLGATPSDVVLNWCEVTVTRQRDGKQLYHNSWITPLDLNTPQQVIAVVDAARSRWKTENENHNVLKTKGYHLEHNFGHGQQHLASFLLTLNLLAFLFHTILGYVDERYQQIRQIRGTRKGFFQDIVALTKYLWFESWTALIEFMLDDTKPAGPIRNTS